MVENKPTICVTIDVEPDCGPYWRRSDPLTFSNVTDGIVRLLHPLFGRWGIRPTYLISPEVLGDAASVAALAGLTECELGLHLHSEYIGPELRYDNPAGTASLEFPCNLPPAVEAAKIVAGRDLFTQCLGRAPVSYRAARFGADDETFSALVGAGFRVDTSITPGIDWRGKGGPDFRGRSDQCHMLAEGKLLEVPVTIGGKRAALLPNRWFCYRWLRPSIMSVAGMVRLCDDVLGHLPGGVLNMMFHSMEVIPNASPYVRSRWGQRWFLARLEAVFAALRRRGVVGRTLMELLP